MITVLAAAMLAATTVQAGALRFSSDDVATLRELASVRGLSKDAASGLLTRRVFDNLSSAERDPFTIHVEPAELGSTEEVKAALEGADVCLMVAIVNDRLRDADAPLPAAVGRYFDRIRGIASSACNQRPTSADLSTANVAPYYTPYTVKPRIRNSSAVAAAIEREYPRSLRSAGIGGLACIWFYVGRDGRVLRFMVRKTTGYPAFDSAALKVAKLMAFAPAMNGDTTVRAWVDVPIWFRGEVAVPGTERHCDG